MIKVYLNSSIICIFNYASVKSLLADKDNCNQRFTIVNSALSRSSVIRYERIIMWSILKPWFSKDAEWLLSFILLFILNIICSVWVTKLWRLVSNLHHAAVITNCETMLITIFKCVDGWLFAVICSVIHSVTMRHLFSFT